jgi:hypothetical protein
MERADTADALKLDDTVDAVVGPRAKGPDRGMILPLPIYPTV